MEMVFPFHHDCSVGITIFHPIQILSLYTPLINLYDSLFLFIISLRFAPHTRHESGSGNPITSRNKLIRLDVPGCLLIFIPIVLIIIGLTLGASHGFRTAGFLVPFLLAWPAVGVFFYWESKLSESDAFIPPSTWRIKNVTLLSIFLLGIFAYFFVCFDLLGGLRRCSLITSYIVIR